MRTSTFTERQIVGILRQQEAGLCVAEICQQNGIRQAAFCNWKSKSAGMDASMVKRLKELEDEILEAHWFPSLEEVRQLTHQWIRIHNHDRPHEALGNLSPRRFLLKYGTVGNKFFTFQQDQFYQFSLFSTVCGEAIVYK